MKRLNRKGFTLIELLAVITILGILMLVAIPAVSRTIENARRDTMIDNAKKYADAVSTQWAADNIKCKSSGAAFDTLGSAAAAGNYFVPLATSTSYSFAFSGGSYTVSGTPTNNAEFLIDKGGKSGWGNADVIGVVRINKAATGNNKYYVALIDKNGHGIASSSIDTVVDSLARTDAKSSGATLTYDSTKLGKECQVLS